MTETGSGATPPAPDAALPLDLYEAGDEGFVAALRAVRDAPALAAFAATWHADPRPEARRLLSEYLCQPPNAPGHEGLAKRLFKLAEAANDDEAMARFLVLCDRLIVRRPAWGKRIGGRLEDRLATLEAAQARAAEWAARGWGDIRTVWTVPDQPRWYYTSGRPPIRTTRGTTLPRPDWRQGEALAALTAEEIADRRWFSVATRRYLQRRAWRYFRHLGRTDPARYVRAATTALMLSDAEDMPDGRSLLDRFGLMHILFEASPTLRLRSTGWDLAPGHTLADLAPAPAFAGVWRDHPEEIRWLLGPMIAPVIARWAWRWVEADPDRFRILARPGEALARPGDWRHSLEADDPEVVRAAIRLLEGFGVARLRAEISSEVGLWLSPLRPYSDRVRPANRAIVAEFLGRVVDPGAVSHHDAIDLAACRDEALARLGWGWIKTSGMMHRPGSEGRHLASWLAWCLVRADCPALRPTILRELRQALAQRGEHRPELAARFLQSPHADARAEGIAWLRSDESLWADADLWKALAKSPHADVQSLVATASPPDGFVSSQLDAARAAVLLAPRGQARAKPAAIRGVVRRLEDLGIEGDAAEVDGLLGLLADLTRSARAPERRASLAALVGLVERFPGWLGRVEAMVPALQLGGGSAIVPG